MKNMNLLLLPSIILSIECKKLIEKDILYLY